MKKKHKGKILERRLRKSGMKLSSVSETLGISRATLYHRFGQKELERKFLMEVGKIINHDFSVDFVDLIPLKVEAVEQDGAKVSGRSKSIEEDIVKIQRSYMALSERQDSLEKLISRILLGLPLEKREEMKKLIHEVLGEENFGFGYREKT